MDLTQAISTIKYYALSWHKYGHGIHSPFVYNLIRDVFNDGEWKDEYDPAERKRSKMLASEEQISVTDLGAGSKTMKTDHRMVSEIAKHSAISPRFGQLLCRMVAYFKPNEILEMGTSLGVGTLYLANGNKESKVTTIEGCPNIAKIAQQNFQKANAENITSLVGDFTEHLRVFRNEERKFDFFYIDGNHSYDATLQYFIKCLKMANDEAILVFDDINWSSGMKKAWTEISESDKVSQSIDLLRMGIVFLRKGVEKEHFVVRF